MIVDVIDCAVGQSLRQNSRIKQQDSAEEGNSNDENHGNIPDSNNCCLLLGSSSFTDMNGIWEFAFQMVHILEF